MSDITLNNSSYNSENEPSGNKSPEYNVPPLLKLLHYIFTFVPIEQGFFFERPIKSKLKKSILNLLLKKNSHLMMVELQNMITTTIY
ncbi:hypothetical protein CIY_12390 [Butyrivibrio fibrisolvens 16/4]|nr:hypothetical protein CIY_12390 [Butyrivibrio fibrisolvens 16/4]